MTALILLLLVLWAPCAFGADAKISEFVEDTAPSSDDLLVTVDDPAGTPANKKVTASNLGKAVVGAQVTNTESLGKIPIGQGDGTAVWADPLVQGITAHDAVGTTTDPVLGGCYASAAAPTDVSADGDAVRAWCLRNGARVTSVTGTVTVDGSAVTQPVSGTFWQATQPVSGPVTDTQLRATPVPISGTVTVTDGAGALNVIVDSSALPTGAATAAKQPALGTAGTASTDVITVQGIAAMTPILVDGSGVTQPVSGTFWQATQPVSGTVTVTDGSGALNVIVDSGATAATQSGTWTVQPGNTANTTPWLVTNTPATSGGTSLSRTVSAASTNATNIKASAGQVYSIQASNVNAAVRYVHLYNSSGAPTCNASIVATYVIPGAATGDGNNIKLQGAAFSTGIGICITTAVDGTGAVSANEHIIMVEYK